MEFRILWLNFITCIGYKNLSAAPHVNVIAPAPISNAIVCKIAPLPQAEL
jgi:hypothetical protein